MDGVKDWRITVLMSLRKLTINNENNFSGIKRWNNLPCSYSHCADIVYSTRASTMIGWKLPPHPLESVIFTELLFPHPTQDFYTRGIHVLSWGCCNNLVLYSGFVLQAFQLRLNSITSFIAQIPLRALLVFKPETGQHFLCQAHSVSYSDLPKEMTVGLQAVFLTPSVWPGPVDQPWLNSAMSWGAEHLQFHMTSVQDQTWWTLFFWQRSRQG